MAGGLFVYLMNNVMLESLQRHVLSLRCLVGDIQDTIRIINAESPRINDPSQNPTLRSALQTLENMRSEIEEDMAKSERLKNQARDHFGDIEDLQSAYTEVHDQIKDLLSDAESMLRVVGFHHSDMESNPDSDAGNSSAPIVSESNTQSETSRKS